MIAGGWGDGPSSGTSSLCSLSAWRCAAHACRPGCGPSGRGGGAGRGCGPPIPAAGGCCHYRWRKTAVGQSGPVFESGLVEGRLWRAQRREWWSLSRVGACVRGAWIRESLAGMNVGVHARANAICAGEYISCSWPARTHHCTLCFAVAEPISTVCLRARSQPPAATT